MLTSALDKTGDLPWLTRRHILRCSACQILWTDLNQLHNQFLQKGEAIRRGAIKDRPGLPLPGLERLLYSKAPAKTARVFPNGRRPIAALAAVMLLLVVVGIWTNKPEKPAAGPESLPSLQKVKSKLVSISETLTATFREDPLEQELQGLIGTAKSAAEFLQTKINKTTGFSKNGG